MTIAQDAWEASLLAAMWHRNRIVIQASSVDSANALFSLWKYMVPQYRTFVLCGDVPKTARYIKGAKIVEAKEPEAQREAFELSYAEEELGSPPIQIVYFGADPTVLRDVLSAIPQGWIATTTHPPRAWETEKTRVRDALSFADGTFSFLDPIPKDIFIERRLIQDMRDNSEGVRDFKVQLKQSEVHLAFQAMLTELESTGLLTQSYVSEMLNVRERTLAKIMAIGSRERRVDLSSFIQRTDPTIVGFLKEMSSVKELYLAALFDGENLVGYAKYRDINFPSQNFLRIVGAVGAYARCASRTGPLKYVEINTRHLNILVCVHPIVFGFVLEAGPNPLMVRFKVEESLGKLVKAAGTAPSR
ncbi:MAG: hypothetical protein JW742_09015 [Candidatus Aminicenantes bacterium]|nr:hypothetical protein [Candidatus Aminicenantes bacterium]